MQTVRAPALVLIGGTQVFSGLARRYAALRGWKRVELVDFHSVGVSHRPAWREATASRLIGATRPGDRILVLSDHACAYAGWSRRVLLAGRQVEIPLDGLSPAQSLVRIHQMLAACPPPQQDGGRSPAELVRRALGTWPHPLLKKRPGGRKAGRQAAGANREGEGTQ